MPIGQDPIDVQKNSHRRNLTQDVWNFNPLTAGTYVTKMCGMDIWYDPDPPSSDFSCCVCHDGLTSGNVVFLDDDTGTYCQECADEQEEGEGQGEGLLRAFPELRRS